MAEQLEFYFPKTKSKHMAYAKMGKQYPSKGGTVRYGVQAIRDGGKSLPKYITEEDFNKYGFEYTRLDVHNNCSDLECCAGQDYLPCVEVQNGVIRKYRENPSNIKYPKEFLDAFYDFDSNPTADTQDDETVELAYQAWYHSKENEEDFDAEVSVGEKQVKSRKDYDIDNELSGFSNMEVGDIDLEDYENEITESVEDEVIEAIRESVDENMPISDGDSVSSSVNVDTELDITVPISGDIEYDWTANETHEEEVDDEEWNAETLDFHGENYQNHLKVIKKAPYGGIGSLFGIGGDTELGGFSTGELTGSSAIHGDFDSASLNYSGHQNLQVRAEDWQTNDEFWEYMYLNYGEKFDNNGHIEMTNSELRKIAKKQGFAAETFGAFSIDEDDEGKIHIENKCDDCEKEFLFTQNSNIVGGRAGAIVYEVLDGGEISYPEYSPYGDLLCKACWKINKEEDENADSRGQGQYGAEMEECVACGNETFDGNKEVCIDCGSGMNLWSSEDSPSPSSPLEEVPATVPSPAEPTNESFNAELMTDDNKGWEYHVYVSDLEDGEDEDSLIDLSKQQIVYLGWPTKESAIKAAHDLTKVKKYKKYDVIYVVGEHEDGDEEIIYRIQNGEISYSAEMDELSEDTSIIRNQVGDMVGMVELDENDEDIEKVDIDIIDDDGEMAYEGTLGAETFESQGTNTKMILGITALAVGLGLWKGKEIMSLSDKISQSIKNMKK